MDQGWNLRSLRNCSALQGLFRPWLTFLGRLNNSFSSRVDSHRRLYLENLIVLYGAHNTIECRARTYARTVFCLSGTKRPPCGILKPDRLTCSPQLSRKALTRHDKVRRIKVAGDAYRVSNPVGLCESDLINLTLEDMQLYGSPYNFYSLGHATESMNTLCSHFPSRDVRS